MAKISWPRTTLRILGGILLVAAIGLGAFVGLTLASMNNMGRIEEFNAKIAALPTDVYDIHGNLITQFFRDEKRELVKLDELPPHLVYALITREDRDFFEHPGFSIQGFLRAGWNILTGSFVSGGSTLTQQLATAIYLDKKEISFTRKIKELWYAIQLERDWSKDEILEEYLNKMPFGHNTHGVEAASQFFFSKSARNISVAESAVLVLQVSSPNGLYSPLRHPEAARRMQRQLLDQMVELGYTTKAEAEQSFEEYWKTFDYTRSPNDTAFFSRVDKAPYFSEYVRYQLENEYLLGDADIYRDGYKVYTTLDLDQQKIADDLMATAIDNTNTVFHDRMKLRSKYGEANFVPIMDLLSMSFNMPQISVGASKDIGMAKAQFRDMINPMLDLVSSQFAFGGSLTIRDVVSKGSEDTINKSKQNTVQGAFIAMNNENGYVSAMVGGRQWDADHQFNRATDARLQPGSTFKPLYYAAGIEKEVITPATKIPDAQVVFQNDDGTLYRPLNYAGGYVGSVLVRTALANSLNIPSLRILNKIGFDDAIAVSTRLLDIPADELQERGFVRRYPLGLGVVSVAPIELVKAFSVFKNLGRQINPITIRYITDRNGTLVSEPEKIIQEDLARKGSAAQLISPQTSYIMTSMLESAVNEGTIAHVTRDIGGFGGMPMAGKTGTTQNWSDAWTVGYSPYYTAAVWLGFDAGGNISLGKDQTGAQIAAPVWGNFMKEIHKNLPVKQFRAPDSGLTSVTVTRSSGLLPPPGYQGAVRNELFRWGTEPKQIDENVSREAEQQTDFMDKIESQYPQIGIPGDYGFDVGNAFEVPDGFTGTKVEPGEAVVPRTTTGNKNGNGSGQDSNTTGNSLLND